MAERLQEKIKLATWPHRAITLSMGISQRQSGMDIGALVKRADEALYDAKASVRDRITLAQA